MSGCGKNVESKMWNKEGFLGHKTARKNFQNSNLVQKYIELKKVERYGHQWQANEENTYRFCTVHVSKFMRLHEVDSTPRIKPDVVSTSTNKFTKLPLSLIAGCQHSI
jgi:hypothetical protein